MSRCISILGSTGSIGRQSLDVIAACGMRAAALTANRSVRELEEQARRFQPELAVLMEEDAAADLKVRLADTGVRVAAGMEGLLEAASLPGADTVLTAVVGMVGLRPTLAAIREGKRIALANKGDPGMCGGAGDVGSGGVRRGDPAGGLGALRPLPEPGGLPGPGRCEEADPDLLRGALYGRTASELKGMTREDALQHPNWSMGAKITVDSATLMNKGLEFIEAMHLYHMPPEKISIVIHRESIIHSLVEYCDNAMIAQLGTPDMRLPIQYALTWPERIPGPASPLDLWNCGPLTFGTPDLDTFRCLPLALEAARTGGTAGAILNGANEAAVARFLEGKIGFLDIAEQVARAMDQVPVVQRPTLEDILEADRAARAV